jgi:hypothetical protein
MLRQSDILKAEIAKKAFVEFRFHYEYKLAYLIHNFPFLQVVTILFKDR